MENYLNELESNSIKLSKSHYLLAIAIASLSVFVISCCLIEISIIHAAYAQSICYFELAWFSAHKSKEIDIPIRSVFFSIIAGRLVLELPIRIVGFQDSIASLMALIICLICIILGILCNRINKPYIYIISLLTIILLNSAIHTLWLDFIHTIN